MAAASAAVAVLGTDVELVGGIAHIPAALPGSSAPDLTAMPALLGGAVAVALVGLAQAASIRPSMPNPDGFKTSVNGDFAAQGLANLVGGLFQALPSGGSLSRTGVAVSAGARTRWAGILSGVLLALIVLVCAALAERIPMPVIGGLILVVGGELIWASATTSFSSCARTPLSSAAMALTFLATTRLPLQQAILIGAVLSLLLYCVQAARRSRLVALTADATGRWHPGDVPASLPPGEVTVLYYYDGVGFFAELPGIERTLPPADHARGAVLILVMRGVPDVPSSTMTKVLRRRARDLRRSGGRLILAGVEPGLAIALEAAGLDRDLGPDGIVPAGGALFDPLDQALTTARAWITAARSASRHDPQEGPEQPGRPEPQPLGGP